MSESATRKDIDEVNKRLDQFDRDLRSFDKYEMELAVRDNQFEKLLTWARKVSEKTGIPLENL